MQFIYPAFLLGLLALAIPYLVHLFHFRRYQKVFFSNVQFLKNIQQQQSSKKNLRKRLILISRMLVLAFLVLAFARPYVPSKPNANLGRQHVISIFVDNSYSMLTVNREGTLLDEARNRAKEIAGAYSLNDRFQLLTQDFEGRHQRLLSREEFNDEVDKIKVSPQSRTLQQIVNRQQSLLNTQPGQAASIYVLSDFQQNLFNGHPVKTLSATALNLIRLKATSLPNVAVDSVWLLNAIHRPAESEKLIVRLHNYADEQAEKVPLKLMINGIQKAIGSFSLGKRAVQNDTISFSGLNAGWQSAEIALEDNPVNFDNQFYFTFCVKQQMPVLLLDGGTPNPYIQALFNTDPFFNPQALHYGNVDYARLSAYPLVVLSDIKSISAGLSQQLQTYVKKGGTLQVFPADGADLASYQSLLQPLGAPYPEKLITEKTKLCCLNLQSPVFKNTFEQLPQNPDMPQVSKYYQLSQPLASGENLMELPGNKTFIGDYSSGGGKVYVSAVPLQDDYSNLAHHALFVPLMFRLALLSGHDSPLSYTIGQDENVELPPVQSSDKQLLKLTKGQQTIIPDVRQQEGSTLLYFSDQVHEPGSYTLKKQDSTVAMIAFNNTRSESDLTYLDDTSLKAQTGSGGNTFVVNSGPTLKDAVVNANRGIELWKLCIILSLISLAAEILLIRFYQAEKQAVSVPIT